MRRQMHRGMIAALLSAFVWPGAGQLYNREFKKGALLIGLTLAVAVAVMIATAAEVTRQLPANIDDLDADLVRTLPAQVLAARPGTLLASSLLLLAAWGYGIVDAYFGGRGRRKLSPRSGTEPRTPPGPPGAA
jgi:Mn2+/Fe2+ NRAMP family transporter